MSIANLPAFLAGLVTLLTLMGAAYVGLRKLQPSVARIEVDTADKLVGIAERAARMADATATDLRERNRILDDRVTELAAEIGECRQRLSDMDVLRAQVSEVQGRLEEVTRDRDRLRAENGALRGRVDHLEVELQRIDGNGS